MSHPNHELPALGVRQPWADLIVRGVKTLEVRSRDTQVRGPIYIYASRKLSDLPDATAAITRHDVDLATLPRGLLVGTVELVGTRPATPADAAAACVSPALLEGAFVWRLENPARLAEPLTVRFLPYGVWFYPFRRKHENL